MGHAERQTIALATAWKGRGRFKGVTQVRVDLFDRIAEMAPDIPGKITFQKYHFISGDIINNDFDKVISALFAP